jgi:predicted DNA-binding transcriptional regulator YafY
MKTTAKGKFDRLLKILSVLNDKQTCIAEDLAESLGVAKRSVYRYIASLKEAEFPISFDPEKKTYSFEDGYTLKKTRLNPDEMLVLALAGKFLKPLGGTFEKSLESLKRRIADSPRSDAIDLKILQPEPSTDLSRLITILTSARSEHQLVQIDYRSLYSEEITSRVVEPYFLFVSPDGFWNLRAYCRKRNDWRVFALDRILNLTTLDSFFNSREPDDDSKGHMPEGFGTYLDGEPAEIVVQFSPIIRSFVERAKWHPSQQNESLSDGWLELRFETLGIEAVKYWLYRWIPHVRVMAPAKLRDEMVEDLKMQERLLGAGEENLRSRASLEGCHSAYLKTVKMTT